MLPDSAAEHALSGLHENVPADPRDRRFLGKPAIPLIACRIAQDRGWSRETPRMDVALMQVAAQAEA